MINIPMRTAGPLDRQTILSINQARVRPPLSSRDIGTLSAPSPAPAHAPARAQSPRRQPSGQLPAREPARSLPRMLRPVQKGQKVPLSPSGDPTRIRACLGWETLNAACDVDVSAFLLDGSGKVPGDDWFVFYGQVKSPDGSTIFHAGQEPCRESISVDFTQLDSSVTRIVFVLTINEALERHLDFSMLRDAYVQIVDPSSGQELVSFKMDEYYSNVTSMMIGEVYQHKGTWRFNAIGNGVARDLADLCGLYGVQVV